jgi:thioredoxin reductase
MEAACYLAEKGKKVSLVTLRRLGENGKQLEENIYRSLRNKMIQLGVQIFPNTPVIEIRPDGVFANDGGNLLWLPAESVVLAVGYQPDQELCEKLKEVVPEVYTAGDCNAPRDGLEATREGMEVGRKV